MIMNLLTLGEPLYELPSLFPLLGPFLQWLAANVGSIGVAVIIFTIAIKSLLLPLDYWSRAGMKKNQLKLEKMRPQLEKLQKQYANDKMLYNQKMQALYKKEGYSMFGACLPTIITMVLFFVVFSALNGYLRYNLIDGYNKIYEAYTTIANSDPAVWATMAPEYMHLISPDFLWIKNIWLPDVPWAKSVMTTSEFVNFTQLGSSGLGLDAGEFASIMAPFQQSNSANGYLILPLLSGATSFLSQWVMSKTQSTQMELQGQGQTNKMMLIMMPVMMAIFAVSWNSAFAIYLVASSIFSFLTTIIINKIVSIRFRKEEEAIKYANARR